LVETIERDPQFAKRVAESVRRVLAFKKQSAKTLRKTKLPSAATIVKLSRKLWEFSEQVRLEALVRAEEDQTEDDREKSRRPRT
jgi:hypothetical protein